MPPTTRPPAVATDTMLPLKATLDLVRMPMGRR
jgi:hypothetical protein